MVKLLSVVKDDEGKELFTVPLGEVLGTYLLNISTKEPRRLYKLAQTLLKNKEVELEAKDIELLIELVEASPFKNIAKVKIIDLLES